MKEIHVGDSNIEGNGLFSGEKIRKGEHIAFIKGEVRKKVIKNSKDAQSIPLWYGLTESLWIDPRKTIWRYFNHCCKPNTAIVGTKKLIALRDIKANEELTFDYSMTDGDIHWEMDCMCGSKNCRKKIYSIQLLSEKEFNAHMPFIPRYFVSLRKRYLKSVSI